MPTEAEIRKMMKSLDCSREEVLQMLADDEKITDKANCPMTPEQAELDKKARLMGRRYEMSDKPRKKAERERKVDTVKKGLLDLVLDALQDTVKITNILNERAADFEYMDNSYTIKIIRHNKPKDKK